MKKFTLFLVAILFSALSFAALNPYAYGLSSTLEGTTLKVNYSLNAPATAVSVVIMDGEEPIKTVTCDGITQGSHTVEILTDELPKSKSLTWKVEVKGTSVENPTLQTNKKYFYLPYSMDVDVDTESDYFGRWYVIEAKNNAKGSSKHTAYESYHVGIGLYAYDASLNSIPNKEGNPGFVGKMTLTLDGTANSANTTVGIYRVATSGGRVFIGRYLNNYAPILEATDLYMDEYPSVLKKDAGKETVSFDVRGRGEDLQLVMLDKTLNIKEYDLGTATAWADVTKPSRTFAKTEVTKIRTDATIAYDKDGGIWLNQHNTIASAESPTIAHITIDGVDYNNVSAALTHLGSNNSGIAVNTDGTELAVVGDGNNKITIYTISKTDGKISLSKKHTLTTEGTVHTALSYDYAGNLYVANRNKETITFWALPYSGTVSTPCASKYAFELEEVETYTIAAHAADNAMGYVTGGGTYYAGETVTLKAVANSTYYFVNWSDGVTDATRTITVTGDLTLTANFAKATPRAWAYDLKVAEDGDNYKFTFNATTAAAATLLFADKEGNALAPTSYDLGAINAGLNTATVAKSLFTEPKDIYWSVKMDGEAIPAVAEITDQSRNIYDFYNMQGVVVDNDPNSEKFGEIYIEMAKSGTTNGKAQTLGLFLLNQNLDVLNTNPNVGIQPTMPSGYALNGTNYTFQRLNIDPTTGKLAFSYGISGKPAVFAIDRENITGSVTNLLDGISGLTKTVAHCFDEDGALYVMDIVSYKGTIYKIKDGVKSTFSAATGKYAADNITMTSDGRGGLWVAQNRGQMDACYQLAHVNSEGVTDWSVYDDQGTYKQGVSDGTSSTGFTGYSTRGALAYDVERQILAQGRNSTVEVFQVAYDATTGVPTLTKIATTPQVNKANIDGLAFDYAGDLYMVNSGTEKFYKYTLPTAENICTVPAPESQKIVKEVRCTVTVNVVGNGEVEGAGEYIEGTSVSLTATPAEHHRFIGWTGDKTSMDNPLEFVAESNITLTATFEAIPQHTISVSANDGEMGSVTGGGDYYEGSTATLTATPVGGYVFEKWSDDNTDNPRTITVNGAAAYTAIFKVAPARVFAYNLDVVDNGDDTYTLSFIPNANAISGRVILYNDDTKAQIHEAPIAGTIAKGMKSEVVVSKSVMPATGIVTWAVELTGETVEQLTLLSDPTKKDIYGFNRPQGVAIDNNPASDYFGRMYIALPKAGGTYYTDKNYGIVVMDPLHNRLKSGVISNGDALGGNGRYSMHRVAVNPTNGHVYYVRTSDSSEGVTGTAIYELAPDATNILTDGGTAKNVINGISEITNANSVCFDENGVMYVVANANYVSGASMGRVYKVVDGIATLVTQTSREIASKDNAIVPDGKGGFWIAQHRNNLDGFNHLLHINASGAADYTISKDENASLLPVQTYVSKEDGKTYNNASYRGQVAYYSIDENNGLVAYGGGGKVSVFKVAYNASGVPILTTWQTISLLSSSSTAGIHVDGIAFDYAGNIIVMSATDERMYQYALPIETANTSLVPSPTSKAIKLGTIYTIEVAVNDPAMGTTTGAGEYLEGETVTVTATANTGYRFVNWTYGSETSTNNPLELVVEGNITVTANFEPIQYTLIAPTNDEDKGTVTGAGTYNYGTEVTLTANPAAGYKLLYWSDRSTENPRTITMTKNEAISAYFVKEYTEEPTFTITKMWENTNVPASTNNGYQAVGWDGKIYMKDRLNASINVYTETGSELYAQLGAAVTGLGGDQPIAVDNAGNLIVRSGSGEFHTSPVQVTIYKNGDKTGKVIDFTLPATGRCDFISASGDIYSAEGGYVYFYCQNQTTVSRLFIKNGGATSEDISVDEVDATLTKGSSQSHVFTNIFGNLMTHTRADIKVLQEVNVMTGAVHTMNLPNFKVSTLGGCSFELGGKELIAYNIKGTDYNSEWNLYNMTDKQFLSAETLYAKDKVSKNSAANWLNVQVVDENTAYIYQFCPTVAVAVWKVTCNTDITVTIDETANNTAALAPYVGKTVRAEVTRNFGANKILTLTLPFDMSATQISTYFGNATVYEFYNVVDAGEELHLQLSRTNAIEAGKPYILQTTSGYDAEDGFTIEDVIINTELTSVKIGELTMVPVLNGGGTLNQPTQYYLSNNALYCAGDYNQPLPGLRAFFTSASPTPLRARVIFEDNEATSIPVVSAPENKAQKIIKDGRLIIIRGEHQYNAQGQVIE
ncbi:MAG: hypothetical protein IKT71_05100 [Paludibacteraceae bacterium]|nr:hypothetical protein [Paludibacteraceae bacterium]